ncbi:MAG: TIGR02391 family protein [Actinobacteria bacterium HGW-Actinobacteria-5]|jgi:uncharacterized protein (TIGR02391 family)|nr:MAG: TIGR02391 family protein [Actinobacteria bacterium HGW-Actinobacteria-5]
MLSLTSDQLVALPVDDLALRVVTDFAPHGWNEHNYLNEHKQSGDFTDPAMSAIAEALSWARAHGLIARSATQSSADAIFVTRLGHQAIQAGLTRVRAEARLSAGLHPAIERRARPQFLLGELEQAVFVAMKVVEIRVRALAGLPDSDFGIDLMNHAFGPSGPLTDQTALKGEQEGTRALFAGAYAVLRNPSGHRDIDYGDPAEAAESVATASLLMRVLDRIESRIST